MNERKFSLSVEDIHQYKRRLKSALVRISSDQNLAAEDETLLADFGQHLRSTRNERRQAPLGRVYGASTPKRESHSQRRLYRPSSSRDARPTIQEVQGC